MPPLLALERQPRCYVYRPTRLVVLDDAKVVATAVDALLAEVTLAEGGVARDNAAPPRQDAQPFQGGLVLVGLGINAQLGQDGGGGGRGGGDKVVAGHVAVPAAELDR